MNKAISQQTFNLPRYTLRIRVDLWYLVPVALMEEFEAWEPGTPNGRGFEHMVVDPDDITFLDPRK